MRSTVSADRNPLGTSPKVELLTGPLCVPFEVPEDGEGAAPRAFVPSNAQAPAPAQTLQGTAGGAPSPPARLAAGRVSRTIPSRASVTPEPETGTGTTATDTQPSAPRSIMGGHLHLHLLYSS